MSQFSRLQSGYAFVHFDDSAEGILAACKCLEALHLQIHHNIRFQCEFSKNLIKSYEVLAQSGEDGLIDDKYKKVLNEASKKLSLGKGHRKHHNRRPMRMDTAAQFNGYNEYNIPPTFGHPGEFQPPMHQSYTEHYFVPHSQYIPVNAVQTPYDLNQYYYRSPAPSHAYYL